MLPTKAAPDKQDGAFQVFHVALGEEGRIHVSILEDLQALPDALHGNSNIVGKRNRNTTIGIEGTEPDELVLGLARHVDDHCIRILLLQRFKRFPL